MTSKPSRVRIRDRFGNVVSRLLRLAGVTLFAISVSTAAAEPNYQGLWWNAPAASESGWGINFAHQGDVIFATWFTYDLNGKAWWLTMSADKSADGVYGGSIYTTTGTPFFNFVAPAVASPVGTGTLTFASTSSGTFVYSVNGITQTKAIVPQVFGPLPTCVWGAQSDLTKATSYGDLWWAAGGTESGWGINLTQQGSTIFATWFTYDANRNPLWLSATLPSTGTNTFSGQLILTGGPAFNAVPFDPNKVTLKSAGTASVAFSNGNSGTFSYSVDLGDGVNKGPQSKPITRQVFLPPGTGCDTGGGHTSGAEGSWVGTTSANQTARAIVLDDGTYYVLYSRSGNSVDGGVVQGSSTSAGGAFTSPDAEDYTIAAASETLDEVKPATVSGSYVSRSTLQLTITEAGAPRTLNASYDAGYDHPADLAAAVGRYVGTTGHVGGKIPANFTLDSSGTLTGSNEVCSFSGTVTPRKSVNLFDWSVRSTSSMCVFGKGPVSGTLFYDAATGQIHAFALFADRGDLSYLIGTKQ